VHPPPLSRPSTQAGEFKSQSGFKTYHAMLAALWRTANLKRTGLGLKSRETDLKADPVYGSVYKQ
jgi:hypothetical protein